MQCSLLGVKNDHFFNNFITDIAVFFIKTESKCLEIEMTQQNQESLTFLNALPKNMKEGSITFIIAL